MTAIIRPARAEDAERIRALVRSERLNPNDLDWRRFVVAEEAGALVGAAQLRPAGRGAVELGSLVVRAPLRGQGLGARLIEAVLARAEGRVLMVTAAARAGHFRRWGFAPVRLGRAPGPVRLNYLIGQAATLYNLMRGYAPRRLKILERLDAGPGPAAGGRA